MRGIRDRAQVIVGWRSTVLVVWALAPAMIIVGDLSEREHQILGLAAQGLTNRAIAQRLVLSERTVESHVRMAMRKMAIPDSPDDHRRVLAVLAYLRDRLDVAQQNQVTSPPIR